jgi:flagellar motor component MotA
MVTIVVGSPLVIFINIPSAMLVLGLALVLQWATLGNSGFLRSLHLLRVLAYNVSSMSLRRKDAMLLQGLARRLYAAGVIGLLIGLVQVLANPYESVKLGPVMAVALLDPLYAAVLAEGFIRPCADRIDYLLSSENDEASRYSAGDTLI